MPFIRQHHFEIFFSYFLLVGVRNCFDFVYPPRSYLLRKKEKEKEKENCFPTLGPMTRNHA
jgi:hypothetical protein